MTVAFKGHRGFYGQRWKARQVERTASPKTQGQDIVCGEQPRRENKVVKIKIGWHWLAEEGKMPFIECLRWMAKGLAYIILLKPYNNLSR